MRHTISFLFLLIIAPGVFAQEADSLLATYQTEKDDSLKARICLKLGDYYENRRIDEALKWGDKAVKHARQFKDELFVVKALNYASTFYNRKGNYHKQIDMCLEAMTIAEKNDFFEQQGIVAGNIGSAYIKLEDRDQAIHWLIRSIELKKKFSTEEKLAVTIGNLGAYYFDLGEYEAAAEQQELSLEIRRKTGEEEKIAINLANLAGCKMMLEDYAEAERLYREAYTIRKANEDQYGLSKLMLDFSWLYELKGNIGLSITYADSAYQLAASLSYDDFKHDAALQLGTMYQRSGNHKKGFEYLLEAYNIWKELHQEESAQNLNDLRMQYETEKIEGENLLLRKDGEIKDLNIERNEIANNNLRLIIAGAVILVLTLFGVVFFLNKLNRDKRFRNNLLREQKKIVERKNEEILASIQYAKRIQAAILPQSSEMSEYLADHFILYRPKDVVAGDFYWVEKKGETTLFAAADCTGHGVPGAMVSVVCNNGLNRSVREHGLTDPGEILNKTREIVVKEFEKSEEEVKDGMDIALCSICGNQLNYAGAHNPLWIIRKEELIQIKADKQPIGKFESATAYTTHTVDLEEGDTIYLFSDGFVDQFGGPDDKKFKTVNFKKLLISIQDKPMPEQRSIIENAFDEWKGNQEQVDDVCVMGVRYPVS